MNTATNKAPSTLATSLAVFTLTVIVMAGYEAIKEGIFKGSLSPWQSHTLTIIVTSLLAVITSLLVRKRATEVLGREHQLYQREQAIQASQQTIRAVLAITQQLSKDFEQLEDGFLKEGSLSEASIFGLREKLEQLTEQYQDTF